MARPILGILLLCIEGALLIYWLVTGFVVMGMTITTSEGPMALIQHLLGAFHFQSSITIALVLEHYNALRRWRRAEPRSEAVTSISERPIYLVSWALSLLVVVGTDALQLALSIITEGVPRPVYRIELSLAVWSLLGTLLAIIWSLGIYFNLRKEAGNRIITDARHTPLMVGMSAMSPSSLSSSHHSHTATRKHTPGVPL